MGTQAGLVVLALLDVGGLGNPFVFVGGQRDLSMLCPVSGFLKVGSAGTCGGIRRRV